MGGEGQMMSGEMASQVTVQVDKAELVYAPVSFTSLDKGTQDAVKKC